MKELERSRWRATAPSASAKPTSLEPARKTLHVHSELDPPYLFWRQEPGPYRVRSMSELGPGRDASERRWVAAGVDESRRAIEFFIADVHGGARSAVVDTQVTLLDELFVQDGQIFSYVPSAAVSPVRRDYDPAHPAAIQSGVLGVTRTFRVMLPRGYDVHLERRYPVLYMYDGHILWDSILGGAFNYDTDAALLAELVASGQVGELILVGIDPLPDASPCQLSNNRFQDCGSPEDSVNNGCGPVTGAADLFGTFLTTELKPLIDATYRTLPGREHTFAQGYSYGGLFAMYMGWEFDDHFGAIAAQAGSFWVPNFPARIMQEPKRDVRIYMDAGTQDPPSIYWSVLELRDNLMGKSPPYVEDGDARLRIGYGHDYAYADGGRRQPELLSFLHPASVETPELYVGSSFCNSTPNSSGHAARLRATGTTSLAANGTRLHALSTPPDTFGVFVYGLDQSQLTFGDGFLCISPFAPGIHRIAAGQASDANGVASLALDLADLPPGGTITAGSTWNFQFLFRDPAAGGAGFNTTDAVSLAFTP